MKVLLPKETKLLSSNVPANEPEWDASTTYNAQDVVRYQHYVYEALTTTTGDTPSDNPDIWANKGATDPYKMFDEKVGTSTVNQDTIEVSLKADKTTSIIAFGIVAKTVTLKLYDDNNGNLVWSKTIDMTTAHTSYGWYNYFFDDVEPKTVINEVYPIYGNSHLEMTIDNTGYNAECAVCVLGQQEYLGLTQYGSKVGILDFSRKERDEWGNVFLSPGNYAKTLDIDLLLDTVLIDKVEGILASVRGRPTIWLGDNDDVSFTSLQVYGFCRDFDITFKGFSVSTASIEIEGMV